MSRAHTGIAPNRVGRLELAPAGDGELWTRGAIALAGQASSAEVTGNESRVRPFDGREVTILARVIDDAEGLRLSIGKVCAGIVRECEVDRDDERGSGER